MSIRWKLTILLALIALLPLVATTFVQQREKLRMGTDLAHDLRREHAIAAQEQLVNFVAGNAAMLDRERTLTELALGVLVQEVERRLAADAPPASPPRIYTPADFRSGTVTGMTITELHRGISADPAGESHPVQISLEHHVTRLAPRVEPAAVADDVARLADLSPVFRELEHATPDKLLWMYASLASGVHASFPGKGVFPDDYDPRQRPWFTETLEVGELCWHTPIVDASTGRLVFTVAAPIRGPGGEAAGVAGIDVPAAAILAPMLHADWQAVATTYIAAVPTTKWKGYEKLPRDTPLIFASSANSDGGLDWRRPVDMQTLHTDEHDDQARLLADMKAGREAVHRMAHEGRDCLWAYWPVSQDNVYLVVIIPVDELTAYAAEVEAQVIGRTWSSLQFTGMFTVSMLLVVLMIALKSARTVTRPIEAMVEAADRIAGGDLKTRVEVPSGDEFGRLGEAFNRMVPALRERLSMRQALSLAMEVQQNLLPSGAPKLPGLDIAGHSLYCDETGGDYYDFLDLEPLEPGRIGIAVGDVTGHGIAAALLMATARALVRSRAAQPGSVADVIGDMNRHLSQDTLNGRFMTLFFLAITTDPLEMRWVSAGHDPAILYDPEADLFEELAGADIPLGIEGTWEYQEFGRSTWRKGQVIVVGTDGIWECKNPDGKMFGKERLRELIREHAGESATQISHAITKAVHAFRGDLAQQDDITLVVVKLTD